MARAIGQHTAYCADRNPVGRRKTPNHLLDCLRVPLVITVPQVEINPLVKGDGVAIAPCLPIASYTRLHQGPLTLIVAVVLNFRRKRRPRAYDAHPFCQDEKTRLPAEMLRLNGRDARCQGFKPNGVYVSSQTPSTTNRRRKNCARIDKESSHWDIFPMGRFFANSLQLHKP